MLANATDDEANDEILQEALDSIPLPFADDEPELAKKPGGRLLSYADNNPNGLFVHRHFRAMREEERKKQLHKKSLSIIKPGIDNRPPPTFPHLTSRVKKIQQEQERRSVIQHNNEILLKRIAFQLMTPSENSLQVATRRQALVSGEMLRGNKEKNRGRFETKHNMRIEDRPPNYNRAKWQQDQMQHLNYLVNISQYPETYITSLRRNGYDPLRKRPMSAPPKSIRSPEPPATDRVGKQSPSRMKQKAIRPKTAPPSSRPSRPKTAFKRANAPDVELSDNGSVTGSMGVARQSSSDSVKSVRFDDADELVDESGELIERATEAQAIGVDVSGLDTVISTYIEQVTVDINPTQERQLSSMALDIVQSVLSESSLELELTNTDPLIQNGEEISEQVREMAWDVANTYLNSQTASKEYLEGVDPGERSEIAEISKDEAGSRNSLMSPLLAMEQSPLTTNLPPAVAATVRPASAGSGRVSFEQGSKQGSSSSLSRPGSAKSSRPGSGAKKPSPLQQETDTGAEDEDEEGSPRKSSLKQAAMEDGEEESEGLERRMSSRKSVNWRSNEQIQ